jgi:hypothetical protein
MIRHLVLFKLNEGVDRKDSQVAAGVAAFEALGGQVPELASWECAWNITDRPSAYDYAINCTVADTAALRRHLEHPAHQVGVAMWEEFATWVIADYEI